MILESSSNQRKIKIKFFLLHCMLVQDEKDEVNVICILIYKNKCCQHLDASINLPNRTLLKTTRQLDQIVPVILKERHCRQLAIRRF
jgi:hypothetical protein